MDGRTLLQGLDLHTLSPYRLVNAGAALMEEDSNQTKEEKDARRKVRAEIERLNLIEDETDEDARPVPGLREAPMG